MKLIIDSHNVELTDSIKDNLMPVCKNWSI